MRGNFVIAPAHSFMCVTVILPVFNPQSQLCGCRIASGLQLQRIVEGACRAGARTMPCGAGGACTLGVSIRRGYPAGKCRALLAFRGAGDPRSGAGRASCGWEQSTLGRAHGEAATGGDDGAHAGATRAAGAAARIAPTYRSRSREALAKWTKQSPYHLATAARCYFPKAERMQYRDLGWLRSRRRSS